MEIQPTLGGISIHWMDFHLVVGIPSILVRFPTTWMEIQPMGLVGLDVVVRSVTICAYLAQTCPWDHLARRRKKIYCLIKNDREAVTFVNLIFRNFG